MFGRPENFKSCRESSGQGFAAQLRYIGKAYIGCANDAVGSGAGSEDDVPPAKIPQ